MTNPYDTSLLYGRVQENVQGESAVSRSVEVRQPLSFVMYRPKSARHVLRNMWMQ